MEANQRKERFAPGLSPGWVVKSMDAREQDEMFRMPKHLLNPIPPPSPSDSMGSTPLDSTEESW